MFERIAITLPRDLERIVEKKRKEIGISRSELFRKALILFLGLDLDHEKKAIKKYGPIYEKLNKEGVKISEEMMGIAGKTLPND